VSRGVKIFPVSKVIWMGNFIEKNGEWVWMGNRGEKVVAVVAIVAKISVLLRNSNKTATGE